MMVFLIRYFIKWVIQGWILARLAKRVRKWLVKKYNLHDYVLPPNAFCAIGWHESDKLVDGTLLPNDVVGLHLFDSQSNLNDIDKKTYPHNSIIEGLKRKYL